MLELPVDEGEVEIRGARVASRHALVILPGRELRADRQPPDRAEGSSIGKRHPSDSATANTRRL